MNYDARKKGFWRFLMNLKETRLTPIAIAVLEILLESCPELDEKQKLILLLIFPEDLKETLKTNAFQAKAEQARISVAEKDIPFIQKAALTRLKEHHQMNSFARIVEEMAAAEAELDLCGSGA